MAYEKLNQLLRIKTIQAMTKAHYEAGRADRNFRWVWKHHIYPVYFIAYDTYIKCLKVDVDRELKLIASKHVKKRMGLHQPKQRACKL